MRILLIQLWPIWLLLALAILIILIANKRNAKDEASEAAPRIIGLSRTGFLITCLIFGTIISGFLWLGTKIEKDSSHDYTPTKLEDGKLTKGNVK